MERTATLRKGGVGVRSKGGTSNIPTRVTFTRDEGKEGVLFTARKGRVRGKTELAQAV